MSMMTINDKRVWLVRNGDLDSDCYDTNVGLYRVVWKPHDGFPFIGYGNTRALAYEDTFDSLKETLFKACS